VAVLVGFTLKTHTIDDDKDPDTGVWVVINDKYGNEIAGISNADSSDNDSTHYKPGETHEISIPAPRNDIPKENCLPCAWRMGIEAAPPPAFNPLGAPGNDKWTFDA
jgi:hypothetical protein